jgi:hypothetical protein
MDPAGGEDVVHRQGEEDPPGEGREPPGDPPALADRSTADDVVAAVDRLEERVEVGGRPGLGGRCHQDDRVRPVGEPFLQGSAPADRLGMDHEGVGLATPGLEQLEQAPADLVGLGVGLRGHHDHPDTAPGERVPPGRGIDRVNPVVLGRRAREVRGVPHRPAPAGMTDFRISDFRGEQEIIINNALMFEI